MAHYTVDGKNEMALDEVDLSTALAEVNNEGKPYNPAYDRRDMHRLGRVCRKSNGASDSSRWWATWSFLRLRGSLH
ncbi:hypothetical protein LTR86_006241 [Recurvomyces mirabilis]|nr:hypothetical protein LTR86_006241 [Recurvomyces mirabilis]